MQPSAAHLTLGAYEATERAQEEQVKNRFVPSEAWIEAFHAQYSGALTQLIGRYAARRVSGARKDATSGVGLTRFRGHRNYAAFPCCTN